MVQKLIELHSTAGMALECLSHKPLQYTPAWNCKFLLSAAGLSKTKQQWWV